MMDADTLLERRRIKEQVRRWRSASVLLLVLFFLALLGKQQGVVPGKDHIARVTLTGLIGEDMALSDSIAKLGDDELVKAVLISIDSPGGTVVGGEALYEDFRKLAAKKPVAAVMGNMATSAAYLAAVPAARIFARRGTVTGSIGVLVQIPDFSVLAGKIGVDVETVRTGPLKGDPSMLGSMSPAGRQMLQGAIDDFYQAFVNFVAEGRKLPREKVLQLADGRIFTGAQAVKNGLVDDIGGEAEAIAWLEKEKGIPADLPVEDIETDSGESRLRELLRGAASGKWLIPESFSLQGMLSVWQNGGVVN